MILTLNQQDRNLSLPQHDAKNLLKKYDWGCRIIQKSDRTVYKKLYISSSKFKDWGFQVSGKLSLTRNNVQTTNTFGQFLRISKYTKDILDDQILQSNGNPQTFVFTRMGWQYVLERCRRNFINSRIVAFWEYEKC